MNIKINGSLSNPETEWLSGLLNTDRFNKSGLLVTTFENNTAHIHAECGCATLFDVVGIAILIILLSEIVRNLVLLLYHLFFLGVGTEQIVTREEIVSISLACVLCVEFVIHAIFPLLSILYPES